MNATVTDMNSTMITEKDSLRGHETAGTSPDGKLVEAVEISANRYFVGVQYHPEFKADQTGHILFSGNS